MKDTNVGQGLHKAFKCSSIASTGKGGKGQKVTWNGSPLTPGSAPFNKGKGTAVPGVTPKSLPKFTGKS